MKGRISYWADVTASAAANISTSKLRSALTIAIVALGITCLVGTQTAIDCLSTLLSSAFGTSTGRISITGARAASGGGAFAKENPAISYEEASLFAEHYSGARQMSVYTYATPLSGVKFDRGSLGPQTSVVACSGDWLGCNAMAIGQGRGTGGAFRGNECIIGGRIAAQLGGSVLGRQLYIGGKAYSVVGVLQEQTSLLGAIADNSVFIPLGSAAGGSFSIDLTSASSGAADSARSLMGRIRRLMAGPAAGFEIIEGSAAEKEIGKLAGSLSGIALIIGLLTLIGAAVALTNIMLICVSERTREVGIRRALGASKADIRGAYMVEAVIICEAGCIIGTLLGILCGNALGAWLHTGSSIPWDWIAISQGISIAVGIAACALPAQRAADMNVVDALRCE